MQLPKVPSDHKFIFVARNNEGTEAFCLWESVSVDKLKGYMEPIWGPFGKNEYFEIDPAKSANLPTPVLSK